MAIQSRFRIMFVLPLVLALLVGIYWAVIEGHVSKQIPEYAGELNAIDGANLLTMWTWTDYGGYNRYSPTGLLAFGLADRYFIAPLFGISYPSPDFSKAFRLIPILIFLFMAITYGTFVLCRVLSFSVGASLVAAVFIGTNKGFVYYFRYASTIATCMLIIYSILALIFWIYYLRSNQRRHLVGYYICFLLAVGAWEQWVSLLALLVVSSLVLMLSNKKLNRHILIHGIVLPLCVFVIYIALRYPSMTHETSSVSEAQYVFSYPSPSLMVEDIVVNISLHIASIVEPVLFPWPMLSQSVIHNFNMDTLNAYNQQYTTLSTAHYRIIADWYAGSIFGLFFAFTLTMIRYFWKHRDEVFAGTLGLLLVYFGFLAHIPIMYRTYLTLPGYVSLLDYKHALSIVGFSIFLGWGISKVSGRMTSHRMKYAFIIGVCMWIAFCNYGKIWPNYVAPQGVYPW